MKKQIIAIFSFGFAGVVALTLWCEQGNRSLVHPDASLQDLRASTQSLEKGIPSVSSVSVPEARLVANKSQVVEDLRTTYGREPTSQEVDEQTQYRINAAALVQEKHLMENIPIDDDSSN